MAWLRYSDDHRRDPIWDGMPYDARWHYDCLVEACARRYDGQLPMKLALRCSDVDDPERCIKNLESAGLLEVTGHAVTVLRVERHVPPPHLRDEQRKAAQRLRKQRERAHKRDDHSLCLPENCPLTGVTGDVTRDVGTGRDGTGSYVVAVDSSEEKEQETRDPRVTRIDPWSAA